MKSILDFELGEMLDALGDASRQFPDGSKEERAIQLAALSLLYVCERRRFKEFRQWHEENSEPSTRAQFNASHEFATQEEADAWRASGKPTDGERIIIAGQGYEVVDVPPYGLRFAWVPLPEQWAAMAAEEEPSEP